MTTSVQRVKQETDQQTLLGIYLPTIRQRFKDEINRLTASAMQEMLRAHADAAELAFPMTYLYAYHWLRHNVHENYRAKVLESFRGPRFSWLMELLLADSAPDFVEGYVNHWLTVKQSENKQYQELLQLLVRRGNDIQQLVADILAVWQSLGLFTESYLVQFKQVGREERIRYEGMLGPEDQERLAMLDTLPDPGIAGDKPHFAKLGIIPAMGCPQTCRHCMFTWRPPKPKNEDPDKVYQSIDALTDSVLFTGGDLTRQLDYFYDAIRKMRHIKNFAILLNGDFADTPQMTRKVMDKMAEAIQARPKKWPQARILLQISFDEFHQEVHVDKKGCLAERIPVAKIANIVEAYPRYTSQMQLALLHKQTSLNFSTDVLHKGVFARLASELARRGHQLQVMSMNPSARLKRNPRVPDRLMPVMKDLSFILDKYPAAPILITSSTIDGYGRAALLEEWETVKEKELLQQVLENRVPVREAFDIDMMFWFNGWVTLFNAVHICLGDHYKDGVETILARQRKDPLCRALHRFDTRLLEFYREIRSDLEQKIEAATGPHHLFHALTEEPEVRLHMTRQLIASTA